MHRVCRHADTSVMEISALLIGLILSLALCQLNLALTGSANNLKHRAGLTEDRIGAGVSSEASSVKCNLQGSTRLPIFSMDGDYMVGGVFSIHYYMHIVTNNYTSIPKPLTCTGRLVKSRRPQIENDLEVTCLAKSW